MKTDRELLELAAKAIGLGIKWEEKHNCHWIELGQGLPIDVWSPIDNDGDALRLAIKLRLSIIQEEEFVFGDCFQTVEVMSETREDGSRICVMQSFDDDPMKATRRAIVRAAAEIQLQREKA